MIASEGLIAPTSVVIAPAHKDDHDGDDDDNGDRDDDDGHHARQPQTRRPLTFYISNCGACSPGGHVIRLDR